MLDLRGPRWQISKNHVTFNSDINKLWSEMHISVTYLIQLLFITYPKHVLVFLKPSSQMVILANQKILLKPPTNYNQPFSEPEFQDIQNLGDPLLSTIIIPYSPPNKKIRNHHMVVLKVPHGGRICFLHPMCLIDDQHGQWHATQPQVPQVPARAPPAVWCIASTTTVES